MSPAWLGILVLGVALRSVELVFGSSRVKTVDVPKIGEPGIFGTAVDCCG